ncbi:MAG: hypothetical protein GY898_17315 [Proteobacteria bacterium]|nr:hypothetical protein [Pseudomonadota bacterium]
MRHVAALIIALMLALPSAAIATPQAYNTAEQERTSVSAHADDGHSSPVAAVTTECDEKGRWMTFRGWLVRWLPIILGQDRPLDGA